MALPEDKREKVRLASDGLLGEWQNLDRSASGIDWDARERARLTVLDLTDHDKEFLKSLRIAI